MSGRRRLGVAVTLLLAVSFCLSSTLSGELVWGALPDEITGTLEAKAASYAKRAKGFSCRESVRVATYGREGVRGEKTTEFDYLLEPDPGSPGGFRAVRTRPGSSGRRESRVDFPVPEPYLWSQVFSAAIRSGLRFSVGRWHTTPWKLAIPVSWLSSAPVNEGRRITEWSGTAEVEFRTGNLLRVVARPNLQEERILAETERFLTAFRVLGFSMAPPPEGLELEVVFDYEHDGLSYPTRMELRRFRQTGRDRRSTVSRQVVEWGDYRFFGTYTEEEIPPLLYQPPGAGADPGATRDDLRPYPPPDAGGR